MIVCLSLFVSIIPAVRVNFSPTPRVSAVRFIVTVPVYTGALASTSVGAVASYTGLLSGCVALIASVPY